MGFKSHGTHTYGRANDISFLYGSIKYTVVAKFIGKGSCFAEHTAQSFTYILSVEQGFGMVLQYFFHSMQGSIYHHHFFPSLRGSVAFFFCYLGWGKYMV